MQHLLVLMLLFFFRMFNLRGGARAMHPLLVRLHPNWPPILYVRTGIQTSFRMPLSTLMTGNINPCGLINADDAEGKSAWAGYNSAGFAIINTVSYNLISKDTVTLKDQEGIIMREALRVWRNGAVSLRFSCKTDRSHLAWRLNFAGDRCIWRRCMV